MYSEAKPTLRSQRSFSSLVLSYLMLSVLITLLAVGIFGLGNVNLQFVTVLNST